MENLENIRIIPARLEDYDVVPEISLQAFGEMIYRIIGENDVEKAINLLTHFYKQKDNQYSYENIFIAIDQDDNVLGCINSYDGGKLEELRAPFLKYIKEKYNSTVIPENETEAGELYIDTIAVVPTSHGKGIGTKLLKHVLENAKNKHFDHAGLLVDIENPNAQKLYTNIGFTVKNEMHFMGGDYNHMIYSLK